MQNKKVLLRDRKRRTVRGVASLALLSGGTPVLSGGTPCHILAGVPLEGPGTGLWTGPVTGLEEPPP